MEQDDARDSGLERSELLARVRDAGFFVADGWKHPTQALDLGGSRWTPDFVKDDGALAIVTGSDVPGFLSKRLMAARAAGLEILCVLDYLALNSGKTLELLSKADARIVLFGDRGLKEGPLPLLKFLGKEDLGVAASTRSSLIRDGIGECLIAKTNDMKGKRLEWLLHFMFSQVGDFRVISCNYLTSTEELDVVIQLTTINGQRCWAHRGPILIAEAKNRKAKSGQEVVSKINTVMMVKRGFCKISFIVSLAGFTSDAEKQVLKLSTEDRIFVLIDRQKLERWGYAADFDAELDSLVLEAILD